MDLWDAFKEGLTYITPLGHLGNKAVTEISEKAPRAIKDTTKSVISSDTGRKILIVGAALVGAVMLLKKN